MVDLSEAGLDERRAGRDRRGRDRRRSIAPEPACILTACPECHLRVFFGAGPRAVRRYESHYRRWHLKRPG